MNMIVNVDKDKYTHVSSRDNPGAQCPRIRPFSLVNYVYGGWKKVGFKFFLIRVFL